ncbi:MAG: methyltransferase domain-containing protein [Actinomycetota bacterium]|nr:methyltransferase domain-containing protein [Actinomycetota bacterium]
MADARRQLAAGKRPPGGARPGPAGTTGAGHCHRYRRACSDRRSTGRTRRACRRDLAPEMLAIGRQRAAALELRNIEFREMDAEALNLPESVCRFGLFFLPHLSSALEGMRRLLVPGGRLVGAVFGPPARVPFVSLPWDVVTRELGVPPPPPEVPGPFSLADRGRLEQLFAQTGFAEVRTESKTVSFDFP